MSSDAELQQMVIDELRWNPGIDATQLVVSVKDGIVTLSGYLCSYRQKINAENTVMHIPHVKAMFDDVEVKLSALEKRTDLALTDAALELLSLNVLVPEGKVQVAVDEGWVVLQGKVNWQYQRMSAEESIQSLAGVRGIINKVSVEPPPGSADVQAGIEQALQRNALIDAAQITVEASDGRVTLHGIVHSLAEKQQAEAIAWSAGGVSRVENRISIAN